MTEQSIFAREPGRLGIRIPRSAWKAAGHSASVAMRQKGVLACQGQLSDWVADDLRQVNDELVCYGPGFDGLSLEELLQSNFSEATMVQRLAAVAWTLNKLEREAALPAGIQSAGILVSADGEVLVLPPALVSRAAARTRSGEGSSPDSNPAFAASVLLAGILRRIFLPKVSEETGTDPETGRRRKGDPFVPLGLIAPRLDPGLASLSDRASDQTTDVPTIDDWSKAFDEASKSGYLRDPDSVELARLEQQRKTAETRVAKKLACKRFMVRRRGLLTGLAIAAVVIAFMAIFDRPAPDPDLSGLGPEALVGAYYEAIDGLDLDVLDACLEGNAGKDDKNLLSNLTVVVKMRQAYSREAPFIRAEEWLGSGSPELPGGTMMYGITGLAIRQLPQSGSPAASAEEIRFEARYTLWTTESSEEMLRGVPMHRKDLLTLAQGRQGWKIISIERETI